MKCHEKSLETHPNAFKCLPCPLAAYLSDAPSSWRTERCAKVLFCVFFDVTEDQFSCVSFSWTKIISFSFGCKLSKEWSIRLFFAHFWNTHVHTKTFLPHKLHKWGGLWGEFARGTFLAWGKSLREGVTLCTRSGLRWGSGRGTGFVPCAFLSYENFNSCVMCFMSFVHGFSKKRNPLEHCKTTKKTKQFGHLLQMKLWG